MRKKQKDHSYERRTYTEGQAQTQAAGAQMRGGGGGPGRTVGALVGWGEHIHAEEG